jgi:hypothetical protein
MVMEAIDREGNREFKYATVSMICGVICLLANLGIFTYLVMNNHERAAGVVFGTAIVGLIGKIVLARL